MLANDGPIADDLTVIRFEMVVAQIAAAWACNGEKMVMEAVVVAAAKLVQNIKEMAMEVVQAQLHEGQCQMNMAVQAIIRTFC
jgi:hypothetical protein